MLTLTLGKVGWAGCEVPTAGSPARGTDLCVDSHGVNTPTTAKVTTEKMLLGAELGGGMHRPASPSRGQHLHSRTWVPRGPVFRVRWGPGASQPYPPRSHCRNADPQSGGFSAPTLCQREAQSPIPRCQTNVSMREACDAGGGGAGEQSWGQELKESGGSTGPSTRTLWSERELFQSRSWATLKQRKLRNRFPVT